MSSAGSPHWRSSRLSASSWRWRWSLITSCSRRRGCGSQTHSTRRLSSANILMREAICSHALPDHTDHLRRVALLFAGLLLALWVFIRRVDVNKFSLHNMYKNRLVRCYLGASRGIARKRAAVHRVRRGRRSSSCGAIPSGQRPYHILNAALNLSQGSNLAWQERKAASFIFSPKFCGFELAQTQGDTTQRFIDDGTQLPSGYRPTAEYATKPHESARIEERALTLGTVLATSGAAVSPNMGGDTNSLRAFMLTVLNARLGRWCPTRPATAHCELSPPFGFAWFLQELFGATNESSRYVYLSDGGHFENLGLYELVRRKCSHIVVVDAAADPERVLRRPRSRHPPMPRRLRRGNRARLARAAARRTKPARRKGVCLGPDRLRPEIESAEDGRPPLHQADADEAGRGAGRCAGLRRAQFDVSAADDRRSVLRRKPVRELSPSGRAHRSLRDRHGQWRHVAGSAAGRATNRARGSGRKRDGRSIDTAGRDE